MVLLVTLADLVNLLQMFNWASLWVVGGVVIIFSHCHLPQKDWTKFNQATNQEDSNLSKLKGYVFFPVCDKKGK